MTSPDHNQARMAVTRREALKLTGTGAAALLAGGALAACGSSGTTTSSTAKNSLQKVTDQLGWLKTSQWAGFYAAINNSYYQQKNINKNLISNKPNIITSNVVDAKHTLIGEDNNNTTLQAITKNKPLVMFATIYQQSPY